MGYSVEVRSSFGGDGEMLHSKLDVSGLNFHIYRDESKLKATSSSNVHDRPSLG